MEDRLFAKPIEKQFEFDEAVASVFDDMIARSVPFYKETQALVRDLVLAHAKEGSLIYDLGSSTGSTLIEIAIKSEKKLRLVGIDNSEAMVERARKKAKAYGVDVTFELADILRYPFEQADIFLSNYTLQFIRPLRREKFLRRIYESLKPGGIMLCSEKILSEDKKLDKMLIEIYYNYKRAQGYSDIEIARKREALENVLIPYTLKENEEMFFNAGFDYVEVIFRWANFATYYVKKA